MGPAEVILASGDAVPVMILSVGYDHPSPHAVETGAWVPSDASIWIDTNNLSQEQAKQARFIVQRLKRDG